MPGAIYADVCFGNFDCVQGPPHLVTVAARSSKALFVSKEELASKDLEAIMLRDRVMRGLAGPLTRLAGIHKVSERRYLQFKLTSMRC